ncbi:hypothetical protein T265_11946 [Opisthorchis viverrini]|uniref:Hemoglobinase n=1 Tax=Opisthorchis viverrini TaxID=6198 RepID=A0A074Z7L8_OPIVI|nr:hypothetical protein T265_11946 [Opisthorchis viverrini]KER19200.1 hypothetical protein T265_11946 [Opisthorchis viverrini]
MMRHCSLLLTFLFCIDHVAYLDGVSVHNWSSIFNNQPSKNWVVLVAGTNTWENYRHQADVFHAYQVVRKNNVPPENIITFAYDDIANNPKNPFKGKVFHDYDHVDVYNHVIIDYRGNDVTRNNFVKVLRGDEKLEANKKVLKSGPDDNVFIFFSGHGGTSHIAFLGEYLYAMELNDTLAYMHSKKKFNKLVLYVEACKSGSMFKDVLPSNMGIYATTSAKEDEESCATFCRDPKIDVCLANEYSFIWLLDSQYNDIKKRTLEEQYQAVKRKTGLSHVMKYGDMTMGSIPVGKFQGHYDLPMHRNDGATAAHVVDRKPPCQAHLFLKSRRLMEAETEEENEVAWRRLHRTLQLGYIVKETFRDIVVDVTTHRMPTVNGLSKRDEFMCFRAVFDRFLTHCFTMQQASCPRGAFITSQCIHPRRNGRQASFSRLLLAHVVDRKPPCQAHLFLKSRRLMEAETEEENEVAWRRLHRTLQLGYIVKETFRDIVVDVTTHRMPTVNGLSKRDEFMCFRAVFDRFLTHCFTMQQASCPRGAFITSQCIHPRRNGRQASFSRLLLVPEIAHHTTHLMELCKAGYDAQTLIDSVHNVCS